MSRNKCKAAGLSQRTEVASIDLLSESNVLAKLAVAQQNAATLFDRRVGVGHAAATDVVGFREPVLRMQRYMSALDAQSVARDRRDLTQEDAVALQDAFRRAHPELVRAFQAGGTLH